MDVAKMDAKMDDLGVPRFQEPFGNVLWDLVVLICGELGEFQWDFKFVRIALVIFC